MSVWLVIEWIDGIPETIKVYDNEASARQCVKVLGRENMSVQRWEVLK